MHTGQQLKTELLWADVTDDEEHSERLLRYGISQLGKLGIVNWLWLATGKEIDLPVKQWGFRGG